MKRSHCKFRWYFPSYCNIDLYNLGLSVISKKMIGKVVDDWIYRAFLVVRFFTNRIQDAYFVNAATSDWAILVFYELTIDLKISK